MVSISAWVCLITVLVETIAFCCQLVDELNDFIRSAIHRGDGWGHLPQTPMRGIPGLIGDVTEGGTGDRKSRIRHRLRTAMYIYIYYIALYSMDCSAGKPHQSSKEQVRQALMGCSKREA